MEPSEFGSNNQEHPKQRLGILDGRQKSRIQPETQRHFGRSVKVGFP
jgi:hypothetical protein